MTCRARHVSLRLGVASDVVAVGEHNVDVFVVYEPIHGSSIKQEARAFELWLPRVSLQALATRPPGVPAPQLLDSAHEDSDWVDQTASPLPATFSAARDLRVAI